MVQRAGNPKAETFRQLSVIVELSRLGLDHQGVPLLLSHQLLIGRGLPVEGNRTVCKALEEVGSTRTLDDVVKGPDDDLLCLSVARDAPGLKRVVDVALEELTGLWTSQNGRVFEYARQLNLRCQYGTLLGLLAQECIVLTVQRDVALSDVRVEPSLELRVLRVNHELFSELVGTFGQPLVAILFHLSTSTELTVLNALCHFVVNEERCVTSSLEP